MNGYVYIFVNPVFPELVKIGRTIRDSETRADELFTTGIPDRFEIVFDVFVDDCVEIESLIHNRFNSRRYKNNREFFNVPIDEAILELQKLTLGRVVSKNGYINKNKKITTNGYTVTFYHISIRNNVRRIGIVKGTDSYIRSEEFYINICKYYELQGFLINSETYKVWSTVELDNFNDEYLKRAEDIIFRNFEIENIKKNWKNVERTHKLIIDKQTMMDTRINAQDYKEVSENDDEVAWCISLDIKTEIDEILDEIENKLELSHLNEIKNKI